MRQKLRAPRPGGHLIAQHLAQMILVQAIRLHLEGHAEGGLGWIFALADKQLSVAMHATHENPARHWTLQTLAELAGMSRTIFASRFKATVGCSVMAYLAR
jgi:AraC-like DNA-binding protein